VLLDGSKTMNEMSKLGTSDASDELGILNINDLDAVFSEKLSD